MNFLSYGLTKYLMLKYLSGLTPTIKRYELLTTDFMLTTTLSDFRKDIKSYFDRVTQNFETLIINRGKDNGIVIMSLAEYNSLSATSHELSSKKNEERLDMAIKKLQENKSFSKNLLEE